MSLFGGKRGDGGGQPGASEPVPAATKDAAPRRRGPSEGGETVATIGKSITFKGDLSGDEDLVIEGTVDGRFALNLEDLTRVDFGGGYERALWRMVQKSRA